MPANPYPVSEKIRNFFSVVVGVISFLALLMVIMPFYDFIDTRFFTNGQQQRTGSTALLSGILYTLLIVSLLISGILSYVISTRRGILHALIAGVVLVVLYFVALGDSINLAAVSTNAGALAVNVSVPLLLMLVPLAGGWLASRLFPRRKK